MNERWVYLNGRFCLEENACIPINDRGFLYGDGIFTTIRIHQGRCELLKLHKERLYRQAEALNFELSSLNLEWIKELIRINEALEGTWRLKIIITVKQNSINRTVGNILGTLSPYQQSNAETCRLCLFPFSIETPLAHIKSLSYLEHLNVRAYANRLGYEDAVTHTSQGFLLETGYSNLFWIDQGNCWIPDPDLPYLKGVFLQAMIPHLPLPVHFVKANINQIPLSSNIYICNALLHVRPVESIHPNTYSRDLHWERALHDVIDRVLADGI